MHLFLRWKPFDPSRNFPDLGPRFKAGEDIALNAIRKEKLKALAQAAKSRSSAGESATTSTAATSSGTLGTEKKKHKEEEEIKVLDNDKVDLDWSTVIKRTFEAYIRGERPNMYGEWIEW